MPKNSFIHNTTICFGIVTIVIACALMLVGVAFSGELDTKTVSPRYPYSTERPGSYLNPLDVQDQRGHLKGEMRETYPGSRTMEIIPDSRNRDREDD